MEEPPAAYAILVGASVSKGREFVKRDLSQTCSPRLGWGSAPGPWYLVCVFTVELTCHSSFKHLCFCLVPVFWLLDIFGGFCFIFMYRCTCTCVCIHMCIPV